MGISAFQVTIATAGTLDVLSERGTTARTVSLRSESAIAGGWGPVRDLGAPSGGLRPDGGPSGVCRNLDGRIEYTTVTATGDVALLHQVDVDGAQWRWATLDRPPGRNVLGGPTMGRQPDGRLLAVVVCSDGSVWSRTQPSAGHGPWRPWARLVEHEAVAGHNPGRTRPLAVSGTNGGPDDPDATAVVVVYPTRRGVGYLRHPTMPDEPVAEHGIVPGSPACTECDGVSATMLSDGRVVVFSLGTTEPGLYASVQRDPRVLEWGPWSGTSLGENPRSPAACTGIDDREVCFVEDLLVGHGEEAGAERRLLWQMERSTDPDTWVMHPHVEAWRPEVLATLGEVHHPQVVVDGAGRQRLFAASGDCDALLDLGQDEEAGTVWTPRVLPV